MSSLKVAFLFVFLLSSFAVIVSAQKPKDSGLQHAENPPMRVISREPHALPEPQATFELRDGFTLIDSLEELRTTLKQSGQNVRLKPGVYRAKSVDPPVGRDQHVFAVTGSDNHFDLRGAVIETPVSVQSTLSRAAHVSDCWHVFGHDNTFEGGYFRNVVDRPYPEYGVAENEFEVRGNGNTFLDCTFDIRGSVPYGYSDFYGKGGPNYGRLNKHGFMSIAGAKDTRLAGCKVFMQSFGHCLHFHGADGVRIENCLFSGALRPTSDIFAEKVGRAVEYDFKAKYRDERPIPRDEIIPLTEDGVRTYGGDKNIVVVDTTIERLRGCVQILCESDVLLQNVTVLEAGDFSFDVSAGDKGKVVLRDCKADVAYNPLFNLTRGDTPKNAFYEVTILSPAEGVKPTPRSSLGTICGDSCIFIIRDGTTRPLPDAANVLYCGGSRELKNSTVKNYTTAKLILNERVRDCTIESVGPVEDGGRGNIVTRVEPKQ